MSSQHALFITQCNIGYLAAIALVALLLWNCVTTIIKILYWDKTVSTLFNQIYFL